MMIYWELTTCFDGDRGSAFLSSFRRTDGSVPFNTYSMQNAVTLETTQRKDKWLHDRWHPNKTAKVTKRLLNSPETKQTDDHLIASRNSILYKVRTDGKETRDFWKSRSKNLNGRKWLVIEKWGRSESTCQHPKSTPEGVSTTLSSSISKSQLWSATFFTAAASISTWIDKQQPYHTTR